MQEILSCCLLLLLSVLLLLLPLLLLLLLRDTRLGVIWLVARFEKGEAG
jgi:hypothetical protein